MTESLADFPSPLLTSFNTLLRLQVSESETETKGVLSCVSERWRVSSTLDLWNEGSRAVQMIEQVRRIEVHGRRSIRPCRHGVTVHVALRDEALRRVAALAVLGVPESVCMSAGLWWRICVGLLSDDEPVEQPAKRRMCFLLRGRRVTGFDLGVHLRGNLEGGTGVSDHSHGGGWRKKAGLTLLYGRAWRDDLFLDVVVDRSICRAVQLPLHYGPVPSVSAVRCLSPRICGSGCPFWKLRSPHYLDIRLVFAFLTYPSKTMLLSLDSFRGRLVHPPASADTVGSSEQAPLATPILPPSSPAA